MPNMVRRDRTHAERLADSLQKWPDSALVDQEPDIVSLARWTDDVGTVWVVRRRLTDVLARRMVSSADLMVVGATGGEAEVVSVHRRAAVWADLQKRGRLPGNGPDRDVAWTPVELDSAGGRFCLYLWRSC